MQHKQSEAYRNPYDESAHIHPAEQFGDQSSSKLEEIKLLCKNLLPLQIRDTVQRGIELDVIKHGGKESLLDDYLQRLRLAEGVRVQARSKGLEKPPLSLHRKLHDLPQVVRNKLAETEQVMSPNYYPNYVFEEIERLAAE